MKISNSKKQLAKIISENGGWCDGEFAAQDGDGTGSIDFFKSKPQYYPNSKFWRGVYDPSERIARADVTIKNFHQTILSRDEYFHLYPAQDADGWIEWKGGECPVADDVIVDVKTRDGEIERHAAYFWNWSHEQGSCILPRQITAYRPHMEADEVEPERIIIEPEPTLDQLTSDYKAKLAIAQQAQEEADFRRDEAEAALDKLYQAGLEIGLDIAIASDETDTEPSPELVITDWRYLQVGDEVEGRHYDRMVIGAVCEIDEECRDDRPFRIHEEGGSPWWVTSKEFKFIRRP